MTGIARLPHGNVGYLFAEHVARTPDKAALVDFVGGGRRSRTYRQLEDRVSRVAGALQSSGVGPAQRIAIATSNRLEFVEAFLGALRIGATPVPINVKLAQAQIESVVADAGCAGAIFDREAGAHVEAALASSGLGLTWSVGGEGESAYETQLARSDGRYAAFSPPERHPAIQMYTSGSTGTPKGVVLGHEGTAWFVEAARTADPSTMNADASVLLAAPLFHKNALTGGIKMMLYAGGCAVILQRFEPREFLRLLAAEACTYTSCVPAMLAMLIKERELVETLDLSHLRLVLVGSAPCPESLIEQAEEILGCVVAQGYGLTEGGPVVLAQPDDLSAYGVARAPRGSCGVPLPGCEVDLVSDGEHGLQKGELWVRNPGVAIEYANAPQTNAEKFSDGWLKTGDVFERDEKGFYFFRGRTDDMFHCGGENVFPLEVENILISHPDVVAVSVVPVDHGVKGQAPVAMVVARSGASLSQEALQAYFFENGPAYAHPRRVFFVDELPLSGAGKIDRKAVARQVADLIGPGAL